MRSHAQIIRDAGGYQALYKRLHWNGKVETVKSWALRDSIPGEHWRALADQGLCTLDELATWAACRKQRKVA